MLGLALRAGVGTKIYPLTFLSICDIMKVQIGKLNPKSFGNLQVVATRFLDAFQEGGNNIVR